MPTADAHCPPVRAGLGEWYHYDAGGSVRAVSNGNRLAQNTYAYDAFGVSTAQAGTGDNNRQFKGQQLDPTQLYFTGCGYYDPEAARLIGGCGTGASPTGAGGYSFGPAATSAPHGGGSGMDAMGANIAGQGLALDSTGKSGASAGFGSPFSMSGCNVICDYTVSLVQQPESIPGLSPDGLSLTDMLMLGLGLLAAARDGPGNLLAWGQDLLSGALANPWDLLFLGPGQLIAAIDNALAKYGDIISLALDFVPVLGDIKGTLEGLFGYDLITGRKLDGTERALNLIPLGGAALGALWTIGKLLGRVKHSDDFGDMFRGANKLDGVGDSARHFDDADVDMAFARRGCSACACVNSFSADTPVATEDGETPISEIEVGDQVLAYDAETDVTGYYTVTAVLINDDPIIVHLWLDDEQIETTPEHPFHTEADGWVDAAALRVGDQVRQADGSYGVVRAVVIEAQPQVMYNLTVAGAHTFFVGEEAWLVHNAGCDLTIYNEKFAIAQMRGEADLPLSYVFWSQKQVSPKFASGPWKGEYIHTIADGIRTGDIEFSYPLSVFMKEPRMNSWPVTTYKSATGEIYQGNWAKLANGCIYCINNRGLTLAETAGLETVPVRWATAREIYDFSYQYSAVDFGVRTWIRELNFWQWKR